MSIAFVCVLGSFLSEDRIDVSEDIRCGRLQQLLPDVAWEPVPLHLVCMHRSQVTPVVIHLRDHLRAACDAML